MRRLFFGGLVALLFAGSAFAQTITPKSSVQPNGSGTIAVTNTFQQVFTSNGSRFACSIQNKGTNNMYAYWGPPERATVTNSVQIAAGSIAYCNNGAIVFSDPVSITGTSGDTYYASQW